LPYGQHRPFGSIFISSSPYSTRVARQNSAAHDPGRSGDPQG
jgi:hypothetical protein